MRIAGNDLPARLCFKGTEMDDTYDPHTASLSSGAFKRAVALLSKSVTGRYVLQGLSASGFAVVFSDARLREYRCLGLCDPENRTVWLHSSADPEMLALVLVHEAVHTMRHHRSSLSLSSRYRPREGMRLSFVLEADAYALQTLTALELAETCPQILHPLRQRTPKILAVAEQAGNRHGLSSLVVPHDAYKAFFEENHLLDYYANHYHQWQKSASGSFNQTVDWHEVAYQLTHLDRPYLAPPAAKPVRQPSFSV